MIYRESKNGNESWNQLRCVSLNVNRCHSKIGTKNTFYSFQNARGGQVLQHVSFSDSSRGLTTLPIKELEFARFLCSFFDDFGNLAPRGRKGVLVPFLVAAERLLSNGLSTPVTVLNNTLLVNRLTR